MATESLGGVEYNVDMNTQGLLSSGKTVETQNKKIQASFKKTDIQVSKTSKAVNKGLSSVGRGAGQAGIQFQQFIGQVQGGQSAMLALSQQSADLGFVLGAPLLGAIVGIAASLGGILLPELFKSGVEMKKFEDSIDRVKAIATLGVDGVLNFSDAVKELSRFSKEASDQLIKLAIEQNEIAKVGAAKALQEQFEDLSFFLSGGGGALTRDALRRIGETAELTENQLARLGQNIQKLTKVSIGAAGTGFKDAALSVLTLQNAIKEFNKEQSEANVTNLLSALDGIKVNGKFATDEARKLAETVFELSTAFLKGEELSDRLNGALSEGVDVASRNESAVNGLIQSLENQAATFGKSERQIALYAAAQAQATDEEIKSINVIFDDIEALEAKVQAEKDAATATREREKELKLLAASAKNAAREEANRIKEEERGRQSLQTDVGEISDRANPIAALQAQKQQELQIIKQAEEQGLAIHTSFADLRANVDQEYANREKALREQKFAEESKFNQLALSSIDALGVASTNTLSGLLSGTYSVTDALQQFANTILNSVIGSLVEVGVQYVKNALISQTADKAILASQAAIGAANASAHTASVVASVAELSSLAAAGAFAATSAIPIVGPALAPGAAAAAGAAAAGLGAPAIASAPIAGQRQRGGLVGASGLYEVGEQNMPELLRSNGRTFMIPGNDGKVIPNSEIDSGSSSASVNITVNNLPGQTAMVSGDGVTQQMVIQIADSRIADQSAQIGSAMNRNINKNHNVTNRQGGNRRN